MHPVQNKYAKMWIFLEKRRSSGEGKLLEHKLSYRNTFMGKLLIKVFPHPFKTFVKEVPGWIFNLFALNEQLLPQEFRDHRDPEFSTKLVFLFNFGCFKANQPLFYAKDAYMKKFSSPAPPSFQNFRGRGLLSFIICTL